MKKIKFIFLVTLLLSNSFLLLAQEEIMMPPPPMPPYFELSQVEEQEYLKNTSSELKLKLKEIKEASKEKYAELLRQLHWTNMENSFMHMGNEKDIIKKEKEIVEYEILVESLSIEYQKASSSEKEKIRNELQKNLSNLFDLKEIRKESEVKILEEKIKELKDKIASRKKNKDIIIRRRTEELLGEGKYLEWD